MILSCSFHRLGGKEELRGESGKRWSLLLSFSWQESLIRQFDATLECSLRRLRILTLVLSYIHNRAFSCDATAAMLVFQNKEMAAMMVYQTNPPGIELYFYANTFFCFSNPIWLLVT